MERVGALKLIFRIHIRRTPCPSQTPEAFGPGSETDTRPCRPHFHGSSLSCLPSPAPSEAYRFFPESLRYIPWERTALCLPPISLCPFKVIRFSVYAYISLYCVLHAQDAVAAFQKGNQGKRPHDAVLYGRKGAEFQPSFRFQPRCAYCQPYPPFAKSVSSNGNRPAPPPERLPRQGNRPGLLLCDNLYGTGSVSPCLMHCRYYRQSLRVGLAFEIPSVEPSPLS